MTLFLTKKHAEVIRAAVNYVAARRAMREAKRSELSYDDFERIFEKADLAFDELVRTVDRLL